MSQQREHSIRPSRRILASAGTIFLSFSFGLTSIPAQAAPPPSSNAEVLPNLTFFAEGRAAAYAKDNNISTSEAVLLFRQSEAFQDTVVRIKQLFPNQYSEAIFRVPNQSYGYVAFKDEVPDVAAALIRELGFEVRSIGNTPMGEVERGQATSAGLAKFTQLIEAKTAHAGIEPGTQILEILYEGDSRAVTPDIENQVISAANSALPELKNINLTLSVAQSESPVATNEVLSGGTALGAGPTSAELRCTAAFTVRNTYGGTGLLTAGHCDNFLNYERRNILSFAGTAEGTHTDAQWHKSSESVWNQFIYTNVGGVKLAPVDRVDINSIGDPVDHFGWSTGRGGRPIVATQQSDTVAGIQKDGLVYVEDWITNGGDSGGPWYQGNGGRGVHSGSGYYKFKKRSSYTPLTQVQALTNLRVITS